MTESDGIDEEELRSTKTKIESKRSEVQKSYNDLTNIIKTLKEISLTDKRVRNESGGYDIIEEYPIDQLCNSEMSKERRKEILASCKIEASKYLTD